MNFMSYLLFIYSLYYFYKRRVIKVDTIVLKFGGSSIADDQKLNLVADKITNLYKKNHNIVVVVSAQGKTTDKLISEAK